MNQRPPCPLCEISEPRWSGKGMRGGMLSLDHPSPLFGLDLASESESWLVMFGPHAKDLALAR
jgi:hypothetical protein